jgi:uncharacterized protein (TIGR00255 family)
MLLSMTGFGRGNKSFHDKSISVEIRSLNSKFTEVRIKAPQNYRDKEPEIRKILSDRLERGKIEFTLEIQSLKADENSVINSTLFRRYYQELSQLTSELGIPPGDIVQSLLRLPDVVSNAGDLVDEEEWKTVLQLIDETMVEFERFRLTEGKSIESDMRQRIGIILDHLRMVAPFEEERISKLRQRIYQNLEDYLGKEKIDENRFEQEILFYLEKMDISEEKLRLGQHCNFFLEELASPATQKGRKLSFITQEIGREINTLGAKSYSSEIQKMVVVMKDELEKIKEQVANCL